MYITIHYTYDESLDGLSWWYEMAESVCTRSILVWDEGTGSQNFHHPWLESRGVVTVVEEEFRSQPCLTIQYTNGEWLEGLRCCEWSESVRTYSIWVWKVGLGQARFVPTPNRKIGCSKHFRAHAPIWTMYNHSLYLWWEIGWVELIWNGWISLYMSNLGVKHRDPEPKFSPLVSQKSGCSDGCGGWILLSTLFDHLIY